MLVCCVVYKSQAQEDNAVVSLTEDTTSLKDFKVFRSLSMALINPDSVFRLDLSRQKLKEVPDKIRVFKNLRELKVNHNSIKELPTWIGDFTKLEVLEASNNDLVEIPPSIGNLVNLKFLGLNRNLIETLPHEIGLVSKLEVLEMWDNELGSVPEEIKNLKRLKTFELRGILFSADQQQQISELLPDTQIYFSPTCNCKN
jgi:Leucine-rich repeat (LRR) protein